jgi:hypothetical protein
MFRQIPGDQPSNRLAHHRAPYRRSIANVKAVTDKSQTAIQASRTISPPIFHVAAIPGNGALLVPLLRARPLIILELAAEAGSRTHWTLNRRPPVKLKPYHGTLSSGIGVLLFIAQNLSSRLLPILLLGVWEFSRCVRGDNPRIFCVGLFASWVPGQGESAHATSLVHNVLGLKQKLKRVMGTDPSFSFRTPAAHIEALLS